MRRRREAYVEPDLRHLFIELTSQCNERRLHCGSCLDVERREGTIAGNVYRDDFVDVWRNRFGFMRRDLAELCEGCRACEDRDYCAGGSWHSFDFDSGSQRMCLKGTLFT